MILLAAAKALPDAFTDICGPVAVAYGEKEGRDSAKGQRLILKSAHPATHHNTVARDLMFGAIREPVGDTVLRDCGRGAWTMLEKPSRDSQASRNISM